MTTDEDKWINSNINKLTSDYDDYIAACETQCNSPLEFDEWCSEQFNKLDFSDEAYERFKDER